MFRKLFKYKSNPGDLFSSILGYSKNRLSSIVKMEVNYKYNII